VPCAASAIDVILGDVLSGPADALTEVPGSLPHATTHRLDPGAGTLADLLYRAPRTLADLLYRAPRTLADLPQAASRALADLGSSRTDSAGQIGQNLRVIIDRPHHLAEDQRDLVQANLELGDRIHALDIKQDTRQRHLGAHMKLEQIQDAGLQGDLGLEVVDFEVDFLNLEGRNVKEHIGRISR